jgi:hypothetical protein
MFAAASAKQPTMLAACFAGDVVHGERPAMASCHIDAWSSGRCRDLPPIFHRFVQEQTSREREWRRFAMFVKALWRL